MVRRSAGRSGSTIMFYGCNQELVMSNMSGYGTKFDIHDRFCGFPIEVDLGVTIHMSCLIVLCVVSLVVSCINGCCV